MNKKKGIMKFLDITRELALGFGIALLIPVIAHYIALVIHPQPAIKQAINYNNSKKN